MPRTSRATVAVPVALALLCLAVLLPATAAGGTTAAAPAAPAAPAAGTTGTVTFGPEPADCPATGGYECSTFEVTCAAPHDGLAPVAGRMAVGAETPGMRFKGIVMFFVGNDGMEYWGATEDRRLFLDELHNRGYRTIEVAWEEPYAEGTTGYRSLTCRPAAVVEWGAGVYASSGANPTAGDGVCGFCLVGTSAGTAQAAYPLVHHGLGHLVDAVVEVSGPAEADLVKGCRRTDPISPYQFFETSRSPARDRIDGAWDGGDEEAEACAASPHDASMEDEWAADSLVTGAGAVHAFPTTRWHFILGYRDGTGAAGQGIEFLNALHAGGTPVVHHDCMNGGHELMSSPKALRQLKAALEWKPSDGPDHPAPLPAPTIEPRCQVTRG